MDKILLALQHSSSQMNEEDDCESVEEVRIMSKSYRLVIQNGESAGVHDMRAIKYDLQNKPIFIIQGEYDLDVVRDMREFQKANNIDAFFLFFPKEYDISQVKLELIEDEV